MTLSFFLAPFIILYFLLLLFAAYRFNSLVKNGNNYSKIHHKFSIIIPFRNEAENLVKLIKSLHELQYPSDSFEIIFVDDHSEDNGSSIIEDHRISLTFQTQLISNKHDEIGKKNAISAGINLAKYPNIITIDSDCEIPPALLNLYNSKLHVKEYYMVAGPVSYTIPHRSKWFHHYQVIENSGLIVLGALAIHYNKPFIANGANLCFNKGVFDSVNGYTNNTHIASGDDEFLLEKIHNHAPGSIGFLFDPNAQVKTNVQLSLRGFFNQRVRWAAKTKFKQRKTSFGFQIYFLLIFLLILANCFISHSLYSLALALTLVVLKVLADIVFYASIRNFFTQQSSIAHVWMTSMLQFFILPIIGIWSFLGKFSWKGRFYSK